MPLTLEELEDIQADCLADDVEIDFEKMSLWDETTVREYFENGGQLPAVEAKPPAAAGLSVRAKGWPNGVAKLAISVRRGKKRKQANKQASKQPNTQLSNQAKHLKAAVLSNASSA